MGPERCHLLPQEAFHWIPTVLHMEAQNCRCRDFRVAIVGGRLSGEAMSTDCLFGAHAVRDTATQDFCQVAPCRFPDEETLCEQFCFPYRNSLGGECGNNCPPRVVAVLSLSGLHSSRVQPRVQNSSRGPTSLWRKELNLQPRRGR